MIFYFICRGLSVLDQCQANLTKVADPPDSSYVLKHISIITRHGARSPINVYTPNDFSGSWVCDSDEAQASRIEAYPMVHPRRVHRVIDYRLTQFSPNCRLGELTLDGMYQHETLGRTYHDYLVDKLHFLPETLDPKTLFIRSTSYDRTYRSAVSFLHGLYQPKSINELLDIISGVPDSDVLRPQKNFCKNITDLYDRYSNSPGAIEGLNLAKEKLAPVCTATGNDCTKIDLYMSDRLCDYVSTMFCNEKAFNVNITEDIFDFCTRYQGDQLFNLYGLDEDSRFIGVSYAMREVFRVLDDFMSGKTTQKFALFSAHDSTVAVFLVALKYNYSNLYKVPPFASHLTMEVYEKENNIYCRWVFNGDVLDLPLVDSFIGNEPADHIYPMDAFTNVYKPKIDKSIVCPEMP